MGGLNGGNLDVSGSGPSAPMQNVPEDAGLNGVDRTLPHETQPRIIPIVAQSQPIRLDGKKWLGHCG